MTQIVSFRNHSTPSGMPPLSVHDLRTGCSTCSMRELCLPVGLDNDDMVRLDQIIRRRRRVPKGHLLYRAGDPFVSLYAIRLGHFKTYQTHREGTQQITGFLMTGEMLGMDAISSEVHQCDAMALEDSEVCEIPFSQLEQLFSEIPTLLRQFHRMMSHEITREQGVMLLLGSMPADQRFAAFLVNLSSRYAVRGFSASSFHLRMGREEIGNYLSLTIESISRLLSKFKKMEILKVDNRTINITDLPRLRRVAAGTETI
ncbi:fumarate/nitrate reduction transcriptional regulator Fnr [Oxalobacteraceae bacterium R-40]|uniref:Fumarate/nitrate reduction transcriptional regulator Fnr n=2 Tax=Keguizhuia sedimenti TaxID=3064264 RepID=A0ABU1BTF6_9BURK|nr:fumarate/nitrate reduction transcriptional regulator Fnr [Oxalobacteraceae bacterium R-40]